MTGQLEPQVDWIQYIKYEIIEATWETMWPLANIEASAKGSISEDDFSGLFDDFDVNSNKLGATVAKRNEKLVKLEQKDTREKISYAKRLTRSLRRFEGGQTE